MLATIQKRLWGKPIRYLIGANNVNAVDTHLTVAPYQQSVTNTSSPAFYIMKLVAGYCNLFDEENSGEFPPYMEAGDTATEWNEGQIDPEGPGWNANLTMQYDTRIKQKIDIIELDNPDAHKWKAVKAAYDRAHKEGLHVLVKNPLLCDAPDAMIKHPAACGIITEANCGDAVDTEKLRAPIGFMPAWFVTDRAHEKWAKGVADVIYNKRLLGMGVTVSSRSGRNQYNDSRDLLVPFT